MRARILTGIFLLLTMLFTLTVGGFATPTPDPSPSPDDWGDEPMPIPSPEFAPLTVESVGQVVTFSG